MPCRYYFNGKEYAGPNEFRDAVLADPSSVAEHLGLKKIPSAPFVGKTEAWTELAMKRMLRYAAANGYDKVAWTTGEQQAARYDLSKQLDHIAYWKEAPDTYALNAKATNGDSVFDDKTVHEKDLEDLIGKDAARRIVNGEGSIEDRGTGYDGSPVRYLRGENLKVGGEGMKGFYDSILPAVAGKLGKKFGAKVGETSIATSPDNIELIETGSGKWRHLDRNLNQGEGNA